MTVSPGGMRVQVAETRFSPDDQLFPCALNPKRCPFTGLGFGACAGQLLYVRDPQANRAFYECERHLELGYATVRENRKEES